MKYRTIFKDNKTIKILQCERCGQDILTFVNPYTTRYCKECRQIVTREQARERKRRQRAKIKRS